jgi:hypothetical protein
MKLTAIIICLLTCHLASAQFTKGDKFVAGGYSISVQNSSADNGDDNKNRFFQLYPEFGYFVNQHYAIGGGLTFSRGTTRYEVVQGDYQEQKSTGFGAHLFAKRFFPVSEKFFFSITGSVNYNRFRSVSAASGGYESTSKSYRISLNVSPSLIFFPSPNWAIEGTIGGLSLSHSRGISDESKSTSFGINYGSISLGFAYFFRTTSE